MMSKTHIARRRGAATLHVGGMRLHLILATLLCLTFWVGSIYVVECAFGAIPWVTLKAQSPLLYQLLDGLFYLADGVIILLIGLPLLFGATMIYEAAADGEKLPLTALFYAFSGPRAYGRALGIVLALLLPALLCALPVLYLLKLASEATPLYRLLFTALALVLAMGLTVIFGRNDAVPMLAYRHPEYRLPALFATSHKITRGRLLRLWCFKLSYLGWAILSVLSLGVLLIGHALPAFVLSYTYRLDDREP